MYRLSLFLLAFLGCTTLLAGSEPPVRESLDLSAITLNRLVLEPAPSMDSGLLPVKSKQLPLSVQLYLKPSGQLDHLSRPVQRAAAQIRRVVAPGSSQKDRLRDSRLVAAAVREWLDAHLPLDTTVGWDGRAATDQRQAWPRVSAILKAGKSDMDGRALAAVALLRALKIPARVAWARGHDTAQYWCALPPRLRATAAPLKHKSAGRNAHARAPLTPEGFWTLLDEGLTDVDVDAWSLDAGVLPRVQWRPAQELSAPWLGWERAVFDEGDSAEAKAAYEASLELGRLTGTAQARSLSVAASATLQSLTQGSRTLWVLTVQRWRLQVEGTMAAMQPVDVLTPYRPHLAHWGRELRGPVREMEMEAKGLWTDRPQRIIEPKGGLRDEWSSPPPALGVLHSVSFGVRRHPSVLQASRTSDQVNGVLLRADNLTPRVGWIVSLSPSVMTSVSASATVAADGHFHFDLVTGTASTGTLELRTDGKAGQGDTQLLPAPE